METECRLLLEQNIMKDMLQDQELAALLKQILQADAEAEALYKILKTRLDIVHPSTPSSLSGDNIKSGAAVV